MTRLSNADLLDENVGENLKKERLQKTAHTAQNPNAEKVVQKQEVKQQMVREQEHNQMQMEGNERFERAERTERVEETNEQIPNNLPVRDYGKKQVNKSTNDDKILGMKPAVFYTLLFGVVAVGGYFAYKKFGKGGKGAKTSGSSSDAVGAIKTASVSAPTPKVSITEVPIT